MLLKLIFQVRDLELPNLSKFKTKKLDCENNISNADYVSLFFRKL